MLLRFRISRMRDAIFLKLHEALQGKKSTKIRKGCSEHRMNTTGASGTSSLACLSGCSGHTLPCSEPWYSVAQNCPILCNPMDCHPPGPSVHEIFPSKNIGLGCHFLLQGIFPTQRLNPHLMHWQLDFFFTTVLPGKPPLLNRAFQKLDSLKICSTAVGGDIVLPWDVRAGRDPQNLPV